MDRGIAAMNRLLNFYRLVVLFLSACLLVTVWENGRLCDRLKQNNAALAKLMAQEQVNEAQVRTNSILLTQLDGEAWRAVTLAGGAGWFYGCAGVSLQDCTNMI